MAQVAAQVSHDIRSPLSALSTITGQLQNVSEQQRLIIRSSVQRITDIANQLLQKGRDLKKESLNGAVLKSSDIKSKSFIQLLAPPIEMIVSEKRIQYREKQQLEIEAHLEQSYGLFANVDSIELKRSLSNLITNSCEAFSDFKGKVIVCVNKTTDNGCDWVSISVKDNGKGIPQHILEKLGQEGITHGKEGSHSGSGLGVYHTIKSVKSMGGEVRIDSTPGNGTTFTLSFPAAKSPKWFVDKLSLKQSSTICSLDDDLSIHQIWSDRLNPILASHTQCNYLSFTSGADFKNWFHSHKELSASKSHELYLVDYELLNQNATGLEIIEELGIGSNAILVTSRFEEDKIREKCDKLGVRLIPKSMAGFVPIEIEKPRELFHGILIDDDNIPLMTWNMIAKEQNKKFVGFTTHDAFFIESHSFDFETPLFIDSNLGNGIKGEVVAKKAFEAGFKTIYLATGNEASQFEPMPWIKGVAGKDPFPMG